MDVRLFEDHPSDVRAWDNYVWSTTSATSDHLWGWREILQKAFGFQPYYLAAMEGDDVVGILPMFLIKNQWGRRALSSIPFGNYGGICADTEQARHLLFEAAKELLRLTGGTYLELRHRQPLIYGELESKNLYNRFTLPLTGDTAEHFRAMGRNNRNKIKQAVRRGVKIVASRDVDKLYHIHLHTFQRLGTPCFPKVYFDLILSVFSGMSQIYFAVSNDQPIAYDLVICFKSSMIYPFNGSLEPFFDLRPNHLLFWNAIEEGCKRGFKEFDFCRSRADSGTAQFKRRLHMREEPLAYQYYLPRGQTMPERHPSNAKYRLAIEIWKKLPLALTQRAGPVLVRYLA